MNMRRYIPSDSEQITCPFCRSGESIRHYGGFETMHYAEMPAMKAVDFANPDTSTWPDITTTTATHMIGYRIICERCQKIIMDCEIDWISAHKANVKSDKKRFFEVLYGTAA